MKTMLERSDETSPLLPQKTRQEWGTRFIQDGTAGRWARTCAVVGAVVWALTALAARVGIARIDGIELMFLFAPLVIVPLGMELGRRLGACGWGMGVAQRAQPVGAALAVVAMCLPPGRAAGVFALGWMLVCALAAWSGAESLVPRLRRSLTEGKSAASWTVTIVLAVARIDLAVGGAWLVASRLGLRPMGIQEPIGLLTAVHFHFAGFATAMIAVATLHCVEESERCGEIPTQRTPRWVGHPQFLRGTVFAVVGLPFVVAAGFVVSPTFKMAAAVLFAISVAALAVFLRASLKRVHDATARVLLQVASGAVFAGMVLAAAYAVADFTGSDGLAIPQMVRTHGILNAMGFCLPGLLGWLVEGSDL
jgi:hypothetical protein